MSERENLATAFTGQVGLLQRVLPAYRLPFFEALADALPDGLAVIGGQPSSGESILSLNNSYVPHTKKLSLFFTTNYHFITPSSPFYLCWQASLSKWVTNIQPSVLVVEANPRLRSTHHAIHWMHKQARPVIGWGLGAPEPQGPLTTWRKKSWPRFLKNFDALIAYSPSGAEQYQRQGFPSRRIFVAPNAVTPRPSVQPPARPETLSGTRAVLFIGRLQERKRIDNLLRAVASLPTSLQPRLLIVGDGPARPGLQALAKQIYPRAEFPGERTGQDLEPYFEAGDIFVLPGTGGLAVQQAMAHGLPVIAAQGDGTLDSLISPDNGWRVPPGDQVALAETLTVALSDFPRLRRMGAVSYNIVSEEVNLEMMVSKFLQAIRTSAFREK